MALSKREMLESALKRVNELLKTNGTLRYDSRYGYYVQWNDVHFLSESSGKAEELLAYLHGLEDCAKLLKAKGD